MNRLYIVQDIKADSGVLFVSAKNRKEAREYALADELFTEGDYEFNDIRVKWSGHRSIDEPDGVLTIEQILENQLNWWDCEDCACLVFEYFDDEYCKCSDCGNKVLIPYAGM